MSPAWWRVLLRHDEGSYALDLAASSAESAAALACQLEACPSRAVLAVTPLH